MKERLRWIDVAKGLGTILVVYGHVMRGLDLSTVKLDHVFFVLGDKLIYSFHMPLFFVLSGFFFNSGLKKRGAFAFTIEKVKTLIYPFVVWSLIQTSVEVVLSNYTNNHAELSDLLWCLVIPKAQFWFLYTLFFVALINILFTECFNRKGLYISLFISLALFEFKPDLGALNNVSKFLIYYNIGILVSVLVNDEFSKLKIIAKPKFVLLNMALFILTEVLLLFYNSEYLLSMFIPQILGSLLIVQLSMIMTDNMCRIRSVFEYIGQYCFQIYLVHILVASGSRIILVNILGVDDFYIHVISGTLLGIYVPILIAWIANQNHYLRWFFTYSHR